MRHYVRALFSLALYLLVCVTLALANVPLPAPAAAERHHRANVWTLQTSGTPEALLDVSFGDANRGWAVGSNCTVLRTDDGGQHWNPATIVACTPSVLRDWTWVQFMGLEGWAGLNNVSQDWTVYHTTNGGDSWTLQQVEPLCPGYLVTQQRPALYKSPEVGWYLAHCGSTVPSDVFSSFDHTVFNQLRNPFARYYGFDFSNDTTGWLVGKSVNPEVWSYGVIAKTIDGGQRWGELQTFPTIDTQFNAINMAGSRIGCVVGSGVILNTADGTTWTQRWSGSAALYDVKMVSDTEGWAVGSGGTILYTADGGNTWTPDTSPTTSDLLALHMVDANHGWAVGTGGVIVALNRDVATTVTPSPTATPTATHTSTPTVTNAITPTRTRTPTTRGPLLLPLVLGRPAGSP